QDFAAICIPAGGEWTVSDAVWRRLTLEAAKLTAVMDRIDEGPQRYGGSPDVCLVPLRLGAKPIGLLATAGPTIERATLDAIAALAAIAIERAQFLDERKAADLARQSEALKSALLASLGHVLRTPLTAIRVAAGNLQVQWP